MNSQQTPLDYLNQIAPQTPKSGPFQFNLKTVIIAAIAAIALVIVLVIIVGNIASGNQKPWQQLSVRLGTTAELANDATSKIKNSELRSLNSNLKLYLTNTTRDLDAQLVAAKIDVKKIPASITKAEDTTDTATRLEDARLNGKYDSAYAREMSYQLATILSLYQQLYSGSSKQETKDFLNTAYDNLLPTQEALANYSAANE